MPSRKPPNVTFQPVLSVAGPNSSRANVYLFQPKLFYGWFDSSVEQWNHGLTFLTSDLANSISKLAHALFVFDYKSG